MKLKKYLVENETYKAKKDQTGHSHDIQVDENGDGKTISTLSTKDDVENHEHTVYQWLVQPARGHIHDMEI